MFCEPYRKPLSEAALHGERLPADAEAHLAGCPTCRRSFSAEQALLVSVDGALRSLANGKVPASLVPKLRSQIAGLPEHRAWRSPLLTYAAALAIGAMAVWFAGRTKEPLVQEKDVVPEVSSSAHSEPNATRQQAEAQRERVVTHERNSARQRSALTAQPEVLVSADEQLGLQRYAAFLKTAVANRRAVVKTDGTTEIPPLEIARIDVGRLSIEPLEGGDAN
jgi:hypothetical protein